LGRRMKLKILDNMEGGAIIIFEAIRRWEVLAYVDAHPDKSPVEVAELFGIKEGSVRAWKAHRTMGTYQGDKAAAVGNAGKKKQIGLFGETKAKATPPFMERKRYSNFIHYFDKTPPGIVCPHFHILAHANGCPFSCDYCYLRLTLRHYPEPTVFTNTARLFQELRDWLLCTEDPSVLNAGELCDSLAWDNKTRLTNNLVPLFESQKRHKLLLLTKSTCIDNLLEMGPASQVIVSFSVNAEQVSGRYEKGSPTPEDRLLAAAKLVEAGYEVRIRLDPMIPIEGWTEAYAQVIDHVNKVGPKIVTLGSLRYFRNLLTHAPEGTDVFSYGVNQEDPDRRLRIPFQQRAEMYRFAIDRLNILRVGLCKETVTMHRELDLPGASQSCNCSIE